EHVTVPSPLGPLLVAATPRGICFVAFGGSAAELVDRLRREFPRAELRGAASPALTVWSHLIVGSIAAGRLSLSDLPTDLRATTFQARVWNAVRAIARGQTRTYAEIAREIGSDGGARAVARAIATNPVALLVPCHRVVRSDGALGGYRWGLERKQRLLAAERKTGSPRRIMED
ncbi:MAG: methylated-DNA--[protein]-cysteine S-methyltransferase, partial [Thermoplasmata archaeon]|nr:methylated-DNA--[protein]-cysteine S-methyltransferase [Thermoplasmata archaeon]